MRLEHENNNVSSVWHIGVTRKLAAYEVAWERG